MVRPCAVRWKQAVQISRVFTLLTMMEVMARPIDENKRRARRMRIIDAGLTVFAREGYAGATTAAICQEAGISSGAFFHYFPTKASLLTAILQQSLQEIREFFEQRQDYANPLDTIWEYVDYEVANLEDPRASGFISAVGGAGLQGENSAILHEIDRQTLDALTMWIRRAQDAGSVRTDLSAERMAIWTTLFINGFADQVGGAHHFNPAAEKPLLRDVIHRFLTG